MPAVASGCDSLLPVGLLRRHKSPDARKSGSPSLHHSYLWLHRNAKGSPRYPSISTYAITETGGQVTWRVLLPGDSDAAWMGHVLADTRIYLLDEKLRPVPVGTPGEICVAGPGLARGYLNQPDLTRQKFVRDPFGNGSEERIYRTGDRARVRKDGKMEIIGRTDDQIKLGGHRIELGEIEGVLREHPALAEAAVVMRQENGTNSRLVAYVVAHGGTSQAPPSTGASQPAEFWPSIGEYQVYDEVLNHQNGHPPSPRELRSHLGRKLPDYMLPAAFVFLDRLSRNANGKLDRRALPKPGSERPEMETCHRAPEGALENTLVGIWQEALGIEGIGTDDNFFALGGNSLQAISITSRIQARLGDRDSLTRALRKSDHRRPRHFTSGNGDRLRESGRSRTPAERIGITNGRRRGNATNCRRRWGHEGSRHPRQFQVSLRKNSAYPRRTD